MPRNWQTEDAVEPVSDTMMEQFGNWQNYNIVSGCELTYSGTDMTIAVGAGQARIDGSLVTVPASTETLTADASNPRWAWVSFGHDLVGSGYHTSVLNGTAAADPTIPEIGTLFSSAGSVALGLVLVEANQTIAANCAYKFDKRIFGPRVVVVSSSGSGGTSAILNADTSAIYGAYTAISDLAVSVGANTAYSFRILIHYTMPTAGDYQWKLTGPTGSDINILSQQFDVGGTGVVYSAEGSVLTGAANGFGSATPGVVAFQGSLVTSSDAGTFQFYAGGTTTGGYTKAKSRIEVF